MASINGVTNQSGSMIQEVGIEDRLSEQKSDKVANIVVGKLLNDGKINESDAPGLIRTLTMVLAGKKPSNEDKKEFYQQYNQLLVLLITPFVKPGVSVDSVIDKFNKNYYTQTKPLLMDSISKQASKISVAMLAKTVFNHTDPSLRDNYDFSNRLNTLFKTAEANIGTLKTTVINAEDAHDKYTAAQQKSEELRKAYGGDDGKTGLQLEAQTAEELASRQRDIAIASEKDAKLKLDDATDEKTRADDANVQAIKSASNAYLDAAKAAAVMDQAIAAATRNKTEADGKSSVANQLVSDQLKALDASELSLNAQLDNANQELKDARAIKGDDAGKGKKMKAAQTKINQALEDLDKIGTQRERLTRSQQSAQNAQSDIAKAQQQKESADKLRKSLEQAKTMLMGLLPKDEADKLISKSNQIDASQISSTEIDKLISSAATKLADLSGTSGKIEQLKAAVHVVNAKFEKVKTLNAEYETLKAAAEKAKSEAAKSRGSADTKKDEAAKTLNAAIESEKQAKQNLAIAIRTATNGLATARKALGVLETAYAKTSVAVSDATSVSRKTADAVDTKLASLNESEVSLNAQLDNANQELKDARAIKGNDSEKAKKMKAAQTKINQAIADLDKITTEKEELTKAKASAKAAESELAAKQATNENVLQLQQVVKDAQGRLNQLIPKDQQVVEPPTQMRASAAEQLRLMGSAVVVQETRVAEPKAVVIEKPVDKYAALKEKLKELIEISDSPQGTELELTTLRNLAETVELNSSNFDKAHLKAIKMMSKEALLDYLNNAGNIDGAIKEQLQSVKPVKAEAPAEQKNPFSILGDRLYKPPK